MINKRIMLIVFIAITIFITGAEKMKKVGEFKLKVPEPSGCVISYENKYLWMVSDGNATVYKTDLKGKLVEKFVINAVDLEGITVINENKLCVVQEEKREIIVIDNKGKELKRVKINFPGQANSGFEGITYDSKKDRFYVVNEKKPCALITLDNNFNIKNKKTLNFSKDLSDIYYDIKNDCLWISSDESNMVIKCDTEGNPIQKYKVSIKQIEGITIDKDNKYLYLVSDPEERLYKFEVK
ncbi:MAG TPA: SdiA-regulated domain-containing protein [Melioribacteraceae bacterium]|nr:SdiA-regulated domain-containing protein [Melioribacteraceae bacterium]